tara:strand:+ start:59 stop:1267 length:1209 start_codon:yes stop_codon:yes gene_type:complete
MRHQKLYVCCQLFYPELISTGQTLTELCEQLSYQHANLHVLCAQPTVLHTKKVKKNILFKNILIERLWSTQFNKLNILGKLLNHITFGVSLFIRLLFIPKQSTILLLTNPPIIPLLMLFLKPLKQFKFSILLFDLYPETLIAANMARPKNPLIGLYKLFNQQLYRSAKHVIVIGRCMKKKVQHYFKADQANLSYIPIWADDINIQNAQGTTNFRKQWGLEHAFIVGYSGNLARFHPIKTILTAAKHCTDPNIHFVFVGDGAQKQWAQDFATANNLTHCHFFNYVQRDQLGDLLKSFNCGIVGLNEENTGLSVPSKTFGLLSAGIPVIACCSKESEIALVLEEYSCGVICEPTDPVALNKHLLFYKNNQSILNLHSQNALKAIKQTYNLTTISKQYFSLLFQT